MIIDKTIREIESGKEYSIDLHADSIVIQTNGAAVSITGTVDGENWVDVGVVSLSNYAVSGTTDTSGIYRIMLAGGIASIKFTFTGGTVTACAV